MVKKVLIYTVLSCVLCGCMQQNNEWPVFMHDPQHTGYSPSQMPESLDVLWEFKGSDHGLTHIIIFNEKVIAALIPGIVLSLDSADGSLQWRTGAPIHGFPAADRGRIYVGISDGILCLDANTGDIQWKYEEEFTNVGSPPIIIDEHLFVGSGYGSIQFIDVPDPSIDPLEKQKRLFCIHAETGEVIWVFHGKGIIADSPGYYNGHIYISDGHSVYCLDAQTGRMIWEKEMKGASSICLPQDGERIFVVSLGETGNRLERLNCLKHDSGELLWYYDCGSLITPAPAVGYNKVFFGTQNEVFYCVDAKQGDLLWKQEVGPYICPPVVADGKVAVGVWNALHILSAKSGEIIESYKIETQVVSIALFNGKLFVGEANGRILCLGSSQKDSSYKVAACIIVVLIIGALVLYKQKRTQ